MKMGLYVVNDYLAEQSGFIHEQVNDKVALREYGKFIAQKVAEGNDARDYELVKIGTIDHESNELVPLNLPEPIRPKIGLVEDEEDAERIQ